MKFAIPSCAWWVADPRSSASQRGMTRTGSLIGQWMSTFCTSSNWNPLRQSRFLPGNRREEEWRLCFGLCILAWFTVITFAGDKRWVAGVELANATSPHSGGLVPGECRPLFAEPCPAPEAERPELGYVMD